MLLSVSILRTLENQRGGVPFATILGWQRAVEKLENDLAMAKRHADRLKKVHRKIAMMIEGRTADELGDWLLWVGMNGDGAATFEEFCRRVDEV